MLKPIMQDFRHGLTNMGEEYNCPIVWKFFGSAFLGNWELEYDSFSPSMQFLHFPSLLFLPLFSSVRSVPFRHSVVSNPLWPHGPQCARPPYPSPTPRVNSNLCPISQWRHSTISSSVVPFSSPPQSFPALGSFSMSQFFMWSGQSIGASASVLSMNIQSWFPLGFAGLISLQSKGLSRVFFSTTVQNYQFFGTQPSLWSTFHIHTWLLEKPYLWPQGLSLVKWCLSF